MAQKSPATGDSVIHHGRLHEVTALPERARKVNGKAVLIKGVQFENDAYEVTMVLDDALRYSAADGAWYFQGRLLARNERAVAEAVTGAWPPAVNHEAMRSMLDALDLGAVDRTSLAEVLLKRKRDVTPANVAAYTERALEQCAELRSIREG